MLSTSSAYSFAASSLGLPAPVHAYVGERRQATTVIVGMLCADHVQTGTFLSQGSVLLGDSLAALIQTGNSFRKAAYF